MTVKVIPDPNTYRPIETKKYYQEAAESSAEIQAKWWLERPEKMHEGICAVVRSIEEHQPDRFEDACRFNRLYANRDIKGMSPGSFNKIGSSARRYIKAHWNVVQSTIDTLVSKIGTDKPKPFYLTNNKDWRLQRRAKRLNKFISGAFDKIGNPYTEESTMYQLGKYAFRDACVLGTGCVKFFIDKEGKRVGAERVLVTEIFVDEHEGMYQAPRQLHQQKYCHREVLIEMFPEKAKEIRRARSAIDPNVANQTTADIVAVIESWHLPSGPKANDGKHAWVIEGCTLDHEDWKHNWFPFRFIRYNPMMQGFFGQALTELLVGIQLEVNKMLRTAAIALHRICVPRVWIDERSKVVGGNIDNEVGGKHYYTGNKPIFETAQALTAEFYQHLERQYQRAFEIAGISQLSAQSKKPPGLDARVALREYRDIESERFQSLGQQYQSFYLDSAEITRALYDEMHDVHGIDATVKAKDRRYQESMKWSDCKMPDDLTSCRLYPTNLLPEEPAGKRQAIQEMTESGMLSREQSLMLLDYPDLERFQRIELAPMMVVMDTLEEMVDSEVYISPEPFMDLQFAKVYAQKFYNALKLEKAPPEILELVLAWQEQVREMLEPEATPGAAAPAPAAAEQPVDAQMQAQMEQQVMAGADPMALAS